MRIWIQRITQLFRRKSGSGIPYEAPVPTSAPQPSAPSFDLSSPTPAPSPLKPKQEVQVDDAFAGLVGEIVDTLDLISGMIGRATDEKHRAELASIQTSLLCKIEAHDAELIDQNEWNPALQKAIAIEPSLPGQATILILRKGSTGFRLKGQLRRKQEVILSRPS